VTQLVMFRDFHFLPSLYIFIMQNIKVKNDYIVPKVTALTKILKNKMNIDVYSGKEILSIHLILVIKY
jgi:hypothetical protein